MKKILSSLCPQATKAFEAVSAAGVITAVAAGSPIALCGLAGLAALALSLKAINDRWDKDKLDEMADKVDLILYEQTKGDEHEKAQQIAHLLNLPTETNAANEGPLVMLANGLHAVIQEQENTIGQLSDLTLVVDRIDEVTTDTNNVVHKILEVLTTEKDSLRQEISGKDETISILEQALEEAKRRADQGDEAYKEAYRQAEEEGDIKLLNEVTDDEIDRLDQLQEQSLKAAIARRRESAAMNFLKGNIDKAKQRLNEILKQLPDDLDALHLMAKVDILRGNPEEAKLGYERLLKIAGADEYWQATAFNSIGMINIAEGKLVQAEAMHQKALAIYKKLGRKEGIATCYGNLGLNFFKQSDLLKAKKFLLESLEINEQIGRKQGIAIQYGNLGLVYKMLGDLGQAEKMHRQSLLIEIELGRKEGMAADYGNIGLIYLMQDDLDRAEEMLKKSLAIDEELGRKEGMAIQYGNLGTIYQKQGDFKKAEAVFQKALKINEEIDNKEGIAYQYENFGSLSNEKKESVEAKDYWQKSLKLFKEIGMRLEIVRVQGCLDKLEVEQQ